MKIEEEEEKKRENSQQINIISRHKKDISNGRRDVVGGLIRRHGALRVALLSASRQHGIASRKSTTALPRCHRCAIFLFAQTK